jgi:hypothetical protein
MISCRLLLAAGLCTALSGCAGVADIAGTVGAVASGAATGNPAVAIGVGGAIRGAVDASEKAYARVEARSTHSAIVAVAADLNPGQSDTWHEPRRFGADGSGQIEVMRLIRSPIGTCKEIAFTVDGQPDDVGPYRAAICNTDGLWRWGLAEPSTERWSILR